MVILNKKYWNSKVSHMELLEIINQRGGILLSKYVNIRTKVKVKCEKGHVWEATPKNLKAKYKKSWCPHCPKQVISTIKRIQK